MPAPTALQRIDDALGAVESWVSAAARLLRPLHMSSRLRVLRAAEENDLPRLARVLAQGGPVNATLTREEAVINDDAGMTPLHHAVHHGNLEMVELLLSHGAAPNAPRVWGETPWWDWLQKNNKQAYAAVPPRLLENEYAIGVALLAHGASMETCVPPYQRASTIASRVHGPLLEILAGMQGEAARQCATMLDAHVAPSHATRPRSRF